MQSSHLPSAADRIDIDLGSAWNDHGEISAWKTERKQKMALAMGWRRAAYIACTILGLTIRIVSHDRLAQLFGFGLSGLGVVLLIAGRMRYARSMAPSRPDA